MSASTLARASATMRANSMASTRRGKTRRGDACVRRARITSKEPWWDKNTAENMIDCDGVDAFLTLLVRVVDANRVVRRQTRRRDGRDAVATGGGDDNRTQSLAAVAEVLQSHSFVASMTARA